MISRAEVPQVLLAVAVAAAAFITFGPTAPAGAAMPCNVPSGAYPTIQAAENGANCDPIIVAAGMFAPVIVDRNVTIRGAGTGLTIIDAAGASRGLNVVSGTVRVFDMTIRNGMATNGGGVQNIGTLTLRRSEIVDNLATFWAGGVYNNTGTLTVIDSTIARNQVVTGTTSGAGGAIMNQGGAVTLTRVTISGNTTDFSSSAIHNQGDGTITITNTTISGNAAPEVGAIVQAAQMGNVMEITNSTIVGNHATGGVGPGGIANNAPAQLTVNNSIIANNSDGDDVDCFGQLPTSNGHNIDSDSTCFADPDLHGVNPKLKPLADNGGPTKTHALKAGSPAIGAADPADSPPTDQRGAPRNTDIGAYELVRCRGVVVNRVGTAGKDLLVGTRARDGFLGFGGADTIKAKAGNDAACGGRGKDVLVGGGGNDKLDGDQGRDTLRGGGGNDNLLGDLGNDKLYGGAASDKLNGGDGTDLCRQGGGVGPVTNCER